MTKLKQLNEQEMIKNKNRFKKLLEYSFVNQEDDLLLDEDKPEDEDPSQGGMPNPSGGAPQPDVNQPQPDASQNDPSQPNIDTSSDPSIDANQGQMPVEPEAPATIDAATAEMPVAPEEPAEDDIEIDVTDLTDGQSELSQKMAMMSNQTRQMMDTLTKLADKVQSIVQNTGSEMAQLKQELVKRNPTPVETLQKRITVSDPFTQTPADYWNKKEQTSNYRLSDNEDENEEYIIKSSDIDSSNVQDVYKSFNLDDDEMNQSLSTMFKF